MYVVPLSRSAIAAQQNTWLTSFSSAGGKRSSSLGTNWNLVIGGLTVVLGVAVGPVGCFGVVDRTPAGVFLRCPFAVAVDSGRYFRTASAVRPGQVWNCLLLMALIHVEGGGLNAHWCKNWISLAFDDSW